MGIELELWVLLVLMTLGSASVTLRSCFQWL